MDQLKFLWQQQKQHKEMTSIIQTTFGTEIFFYSFTFASNIFFFPHIKMFCFSFLNFLLLVTCFQEEIFEIFLLCTNLIVFVSAVQ